MSLVDIITIIYMTLTFVGLTIIYIHQTSKPKKFNTNKYVIVYTNRENESLQHILNITEKNEDEIQGFLDGFRDAFERNGYTVYITPIIYKPSL